MLSLLLLCACTHEDIEPVTSNAIGFGYDTLNEWKTPGNSMQGSPTSGSRKLTRSTAMQNFGVYAFLVGKTSDTPPEYNGGSSTIMHMGKETAGIEVVKSGDEYGYSPVKYWPGSLFWVKFLAYSPYDITELDGCSIDLNAHLPIINFKNNAAVDLAVAATGMYQGDYENIVELPFEHVLSCVEFRQGTMPAGIDVKSVKLVGVRNVGSYNMAQSSWGWPTSGSITADYPVVLGRRLYMMPHQLLAGAKINVVTTDDAEYDVDIAGWEWGKGNRYVYTLKIEETSDKQYGLVVGVEDYRYQDNGNVIW